MEKMLLSDNDIETLIAFEKNSSLELLAKALGKDQTVISKRLKQISEKADVLTKVSGRWCLNETGKKIIRLSEDFIHAQQSILQNRKHIRLGTSREFAAKFVSPNIEKIKKQIGAYSITLNAYENGIEEALLNGEIDLGFDCGRPNSAEVRFKLCLPENIAVVVSSAMNKQLGKTNITEQVLMKLPYISCARLSPGLIMGSHLIAQNVVFSTNDIASARSACINSSGWALLPTYTVLTELKDKKLVILNEFEYTSEKYGVWMLRSRNHLDKEFQELQNWLSNAW